MNRRRFLELLAAGGAGAVGGAGLLHAHPGPLARLRTAGAGRANAAPPSDLVLGLNAHTYHWREPENPERLRELGIRHVRITGVLQHWEGEVASYRAYMRETAELAADNGVRLLWVLHNARGDVFSVGVDRRWWARMIRFAAWVARLPATEGVQLWNEQDLWVQAPFGAGSGVPMRQRGRHYAEFMRRAYPEVKDANADVLVVTGGTAEHPRSGFLKAMMESPPPADAVAIHAYGPWADVRDRLVAARRIVGSRDLWVTECGSRSGTASEAVQASDWRSAVQGMESERMAERMYLYVLISDQPGHSLVRPGGRPTAAYRWLRDRSRGG